MNKKNILPVVFCDLLPQIDLSYSYLFDKDQNRKTLKNEEQDTFYFFEGEFEE